MVGIGNDQQSSPIDGSTPHTSHSSSSPHTNATRTAGEAATPPTSSPARHTIHSIDSPTSHVVATASSTPVSATFARLNYAPRAPRSASTSTRSSTDALSPFLPGPSPASEQAAGSSKQPSNQATIPSSTQSPQSSLPLIPEYADTTLPAGEITLANLLERCEQIGLGPNSPGYALVKTLAQATEPEWIELARLVRQREATLLLPVMGKSSPASSSSSGDTSNPHPPPTLAFAYDHILVGPATQPSLSIDCPEKGFATLSGLRGSTTTPQVDQNTHRSEERQSSKLFIKSFVNDPGHAPITQLRSTATRRHIFSTFAPLPQPCCPDYPYPNYTILNECQLTLPSRQSVSATSPSISGAATAFAVANPGLETSSNAKPSPSSGGFAQLFGGGGRASRKSLPPVAQLAKRVDPSDMSHQDELPDSPALVWLIDRPLRRSRALRGMIYSVQARLRTQLQRAGGIRPEIGEVIGSFAGAFYPPVESSTRSFDSKRVSGSSTAERPSLPHTPNSPNTPKEWQSLAMFYASPEDVQVNYQSVLASVHTQLKDENGPGDSQEDQQVVPRQMELVEKLLTEEIYDRLFSPPHSADQKADEILASRIAAFNILGLDWKQLGLVLPTEEAEMDSMGSDVVSSAENGSEASRIRQGLAAILDQCHQELQSLQQRTHMSPKMKLDTLIAIHRIIVNGLRTLPPIRLQDEVPEATDHYSGAEPKQSTIDDPQAGNTSSADLILPILIRLIVLANPSSLASQLMFIQRYRYEPLLQNGENAYCLINFQAAVQFIENAKASDLGLGEEVLSTLEIEQHGRVKEQNEERSAAVEMLRSMNKTTVQPVADGRAASPLPIGGRLKGLTGAINSSFSVLGRALGSGASAGMDAWDRSSRTLETVRAMDEIRGLLTSTMIKTAGVGSNEANRLIEMKTEENQGESSRTSGTRPSSVRSTSDASTVKVSTPQAAFHHSVLQIEPGLSTSRSTSDSPMVMTTSRESAKLSLSDRLANLNWKFGSSTPTASSQAETSTLPISSSTSTPSLSVLASGPQADNSVSSALTSTTNTPQPTRPASPSPVYPPTLPSASASASDTSPRPLPASLQSPYPPLAHPPTPSRPLHVVIATSGSVASIKLPLIVEKLLQCRNVRIQIISTKSSLHFVEKQQIEEVGRLAAEDLEPSATEALDYTVSHLAAENASADPTCSPLPFKTPLVRLWTDEDEWSSWRKVGDPILHIELRRWADMVIVAPCSANTLAKIASGICDNLLTSFLRALSPSTPTILYPAMNTLMYEHPLTACHLKLIENLIGYEVRGPIEKRLACGDMGAGAMVEWTDIVDDIVQRFGLEGRMINPIGQEDDAVSNNSQEEAKRQAL